MDEAAAAGEEAEAGAEARRVGESEKEVAPGGAGSGEVFLSAFVASATLLSSPGM